MLRLAMNRVNVGSLKSFSAKLPGKVTSLSLPARVGYATLGATIVYQKTSFCDYSHLQPVSVDVPKFVYKRELLEAEERTFSQKIYDAMMAVRRFIGNLYRLCTYGMYLAPVSVLGPLAYYKPDYEDTLWSYLIWSFESLGPTFIKLAQWASTRPDLFPVELTHRLEKLQDQVTIGSNFAYVEATMESAFGKNWRKTVEIESKPIGCGCVAQVFKGVTMCDTTYTGVDTATSAGSKTYKDKMQKVIPKGTAVAVKMIHPQVEQLVRQDMELLGNIGNLLDQFASLEIISLGDMIREFGMNLYKQLDLRVEGHHLKKFHRNFFEDESWAEFPRPIDQLTHKNVLVETLMTGKPISEYMRQTGDSQLPEDVKLRRIQTKLSDLCTRTLVKMIFFDNYIHGDLHPGNILVRINAKGDPVLGFLDCGIVYSTSSEEEHDNLMGICRHFIAHDGYKAGTFIIKSAKNYSAHLPAGDYRKKRQVLDEEKFCQAMQQIVIDSEKQSYFEHMSEYIDKICNMAYKHNVKLDAEHFHVFMALKVAEGISLAMNRNLDIISTALPMITKAETMRRLGISKFPVPDHADDDLVKESSGRR